MQNLSTVYKKFIVVYCYMHGINNNITVTARDEDEAINEAKKEVSGAYGTKMMANFTFKNK